MKNFAIILCLICLVSCTKNDDFGPQGEPIEKAPISNVLKGVVVLNEGNFGFGNASLSLLDLVNNEVQQKVYERVNGQKLGDVAQSSLVIDSLLFIAINNSNKIRVLSLIDFSEIAEIVVQGAPRYMVRYNQTVLVSTMGSGYIHEIALNNFKVKPKINFADWLDELIIIDDKLWATNRTNNRVEVFDLETSNHIKSFNVGIDPESISTGVSQEVLVLCSGGYNINNREKSSIYKIENYQAKQVYQFNNIDFSPSRLRYSKIDQCWYFINYGLYKFDINFRPTLLLNQSKGQIFYGLNVNPLDGTIFLTDAKNYVEKGELLHLDNTGKPLSAFQTGFIPQHISFY